MWGLTPFDQMWCRIEFKKLRYEGHFTPPMVTGSLQYPGNAGGFNWGSVAIDEKNQLLIAHPLMLPSRIELIPRDKVAKNTRYQQTGTPYGANIRPFMSPLSVPCLQPPYSRIAVVDLQTRKVVWSKPNGVASEMGPLGLRSHLPIPMGVPSSGGALVTGGGVIFFGGTMDNYLRAFDEKTGKVLWSRRLPETGQSTPMSYLSPKSKRQIIVMAVPNRQRQLGMTTDEPADVEPEGGHIIAYALPQQ
jgi:quinate dehydrogenase (quinone)